MEIQVYIVRNGNTFPSSLLEKLVQIQSVPNRGRFSCTQYKNLILTINLLIIELILCRQYGFKH